MEEPERKNTAQNLRGKVDLLILRDEEASACGLLVGGMELPLSEFILLTNYGAPLRPGVPKRGDGGRRLRVAKGSIGCSYPQSCVAGGMCVRSCGVCCVCVVLGTWPMVRGTRDRARKNNGRASTFWGKVAWRPGGLLMNRACASLVSALRVSIPDANVPSARACRRHGSPASLASTRRAQNLDPSQPSRRVPAARATRFGRAGLGPWATTIGRGPVGREPVRSAQLLPHTGTPVRIVPPGGPQISLRRQPRSLWSGVGACVVLAMLDVLASAVTVQSSLRHGLRSSFPAPLCSSARLARGSGRHSLLDDSLAALGAR